MSWEAAVLDEAVICKRLVSCVGVWSSFHRTFVLYLVPSKGSFSSLTDMRSKRDSSVRVAIVPDNSELQLTYSSNKNSSNN